MSDTVTSKKGSALLYGSLAANIFLIAFTLGRCSLMHPHDDHFGPHGGPGDHGPQHGMNMPPPPRFFSPEDLFTQEEMKPDIAMFKANFDAMKKMREDFAAKLKAGSVTKDEVLDHFAERDKMMGATKQKLQEKAAEKIASLSKEQREKFASLMLEENDDKGPHEEPPH